mmetsp:Transcript_66956/g.174221  ORF Transcript_66956/g.174221 Transcript_66956/m.174221 type:complete len:217 (-) Transcript_66956:509-1159(-)
MPTPTIEVGPRLAPVNREARSTTKMCFMATRSAWLSTWMQSRISSDEHWYRKYVTDMIAQVPGLAAMHCHTPSAGAPPGAARATRSTAHAPRSAAPCSAPAVVTRPKASSGSRWPPAKAFFTMHARQEKPRFASSAKSTARDADTPSPRRPPCEPQTVSTMPAQDTAMAPNRRGWQLCPSVGMASVAVVRGSIAFTVKAMLGAPRLSASTVSSCPK